MRSIVLDGAEHRGTIKKPSNERASSLRAKTKLEQHKLRDSPPQHVASGVVSFTVNTFAFQLAQLCLYL
jgi:hypothetical protein